MFKNQLFFTWKPKILYQQRWKILFRLKCDKNVATLSRKCHSGDFKTRKWLFFHFKLRYKDKYTCIRQFNVFYSGNIFYQFLTKLQIQPYSTLFITRHWVIWGRPRSHVWTCRTFVELRAEQKKCSLILETWVTVVTRVRVSANYISVLFFSEL